MNTKPKIFNLLSLFFLAVAISIPFQVLINEGHNFSEWRIILHKMTLLNYTVATICLLNSLLSFMGHKLLKWSVPFSIALVFLNNLNVGIWAINYSFSESMSSAFLFSIISFSFLTKKALNTLNDPRKRWWKVSPRRQRVYPVWLDIDGQQKLLAKTFDLSGSGAFLAGLKEDCNFSLPKDLSPGKSIKISITNEGNKEICFEAKVVRKEESGKGHYPRGVGIKFIKKDLLQRFQLFLLISQERFVL
jgi:hypothetical protein